MLPGVSRALRTIVLMIVFSFAPLWALVLYDLVWRGHLTATLLVMLPALVAAMIGWSSWRARNRAFSRR